MAIIRAHFQVESNALLLLCTSCFACDTGLLSTLTHDALTQRFVWYVLLLRRRRKSDRTATVQHCSNYCFFFFFSFTTPFVILFNILISYLIMYFTRIDFIIIFATHRTGACGYDDGTSSSAQTLQNYRRDNIVHNIIITMVHVRLRLRFFFFRF